MTYRELSEQKKYSIYLTNVGDNLQKVSYSLYDKANKNTIRALIALNNRYDWDYLPPGLEIKYLSEADLSLVDEA